MGKVLQKATAVFAAVILLASSIGFAGGSGLFANALGEYLDPFDYLFDDNQGGTAIYSSRERELFVHGRFF